MADYSSNIIINPDALQPLTVGWTKCTNVSIADGIFKFVNPGTLEQSIPIDTLSDTAKGIRISGQVRFNNTGIPVYADIYAYFRLRITTKTDTTAYIVPCQTIIGIGQSDWATFAKDFDDLPEDITELTFIAYTSSNALSVAMDMHDLSVQYIITKTDTETAVADSNTYTDTNLEKHLADITNAHLSDEQKLGITGGCVKLKTIKLGLEDDVRIANRNLYDNKVQTVLLEAAQKEIPITTPLYWQELLVQTAPNVTATSIAVATDGTTVGKVYIAYVSDNILTVKSAPFSHPINEMIWTVEETIANCAYCALAFDGSYISDANNLDHVVYKTDTVPWLFYITTTGELVSGLLNNANYADAIANVIAVDAVRGVASIYKDMDQGLLLFYISNGTVMFSQYNDGLWTTQTAVAIAPTNAVAVHAELLADWRVCLHITDSDGKLWRVFSKMEASGWSNAEYISASISSINSLIRIFYHDFRIDEYITASVTTVQTVLYALVPEIVTVENIDNGTNNYGKQLNITWNERVFNEVNNAASFVLADTMGGAWGSTAIIRLSDRKLQVTFSDFNNAYGDLTLTYTPGTLIGDIELLTLCTFTFTPVGLVPTELPHPAVASIANTDAQTIDITFDMPVKSTDISVAESGFTVTAQEYNMIPGGTIAQVAYSVDTVSYASTTTIPALSDALLTDTELNQNKLILVEE